LAQMSEQENSWAAGQYSARLSELLLAEGKGLPSGRQREPLLELAGRSLHAVAMFGYLPKAC